MTDREAVWESPEKIIRHKSLLCYKSVSSIHGVKTGVPNTASTLDSHLENNEIGFPATHHSKLQTRQDYK